MTKENPTPSEFRVPEQIQGVSSSQQQKRFPPSEFNEEQVMIKVLYEMNS